MFNVKCTCETVFFHFDNLYHEQSLSTHSPTLLHYSTGVREFFFLSDKKGRLCNFLLSLKTAQVMKMALEKCLVEVLYSGPSHCGTLSLSPRGEHIHLSKMTKKGATTCLAREKNVITKRSLIQKFLA